MGYTPVKPEDIPGWDHLSIKTGEYAGLIGINEMLAFKLPISLYERYMTESHHRIPLEREGGIINGADAIRDQFRSQGSNVVEEDGMAEIRKNRSIRPKFELD